MIKCNSYNYSLIFSIFDCLSLCLVCHCFCFVLFCFLCPCGGCHGKIIFDCICLCCLTLDAVCVTQYMACHYIVKTGKTLGYWIFFPVKYLSMRFLSFSLLHISGKLLFGTNAVTYNIVFYPLLMVEPQNLLLKPLKLLQHLCPSTVLHNCHHRLQWREKRNIKRSQPIQKRCKQILFKQLLKLPWVAFCNAQENILPSLLSSHAYRFWTPPPHTHIHTPPL